MSVPVLLFIILFILMTAIGGNQGAKSFLTLIFNFAVLIGTIMLIAKGLPPVGSTVVCCVAISCVTLFYISGVNKKTISSLISVAVVVLLTVILTFGMGMGAKIQGFDEVQTDSVVFLSKYVHLSFSQVVICEMLIGLLGAIIDVSISVSSSLNEIVKTNPSAGRFDLFRSGLNVGRDIIGTMTNTLLFAYIGGFLSLIIWLKAVHYGTEDLINTKLLVSAVFQVITGGIGVILIIPVTAAFSAFIFTTGHAAGARSKRV